MATSRPFAYNTGTGITGTDQVGNLAVGTPTVGFTATGLEWWNGPDEDLGYVIACQVPTDTQPTPVALNWDPNYVGSGNSLSVGNTVVTNSGVNSSVITNRLIGSAEKVMFSFQINQTISSGEIGVGQITMNTGSYVGGGDGKSLSFSSGGTYLYYGGVQSSGLPTWGTVNDIVDVAVNMASGTIYIRVNGGNWNGTRNENPASGGGSLGMAGLTSLYPAITPYQGIVTILETATYSVPSGFTFLGQTLASVGFFRSDALTDGSFISIANYIAGPSGGGPFASGSAAKTWLNTNGYWTSYVGSTGGTGGTGDFNVTVTQVGPDVVWSGSGKFNLTALTSAGTNTIGGGYAANQAIWAIGPNVLLDTYSGTVTYPTSFGSGGTPVTSNTGSTFGILPGGSGRTLYVPSGYTSNSTISGTSTYANTTISGMGLSGGTYTWSWGSGANASTLVMVIN